MNGPGDDDLKETLWEAAESALDGSPYGGLLAGRIQRAVTVALRKAGKQGTVKVTGGGRRCEVHLREGPRVRVLVIGLGQS